MIPLWQNLFAIPFASPLSPFSTSLLLGLRAGRQLLDASIVLLISCLFILFLMILAFYDLLIYAQCFDVGAITFLLLLLLFFFTHPFHMALISSLRFCQAYLLILSTLRSFGSLSALHMHSIPHTLIEP